MSQFNTFIDHTNQLVNLQQKVLGDTVITSRKAFTEELCKLLNSNLYTMGRTYYSHEETGMLYLSDDAELEDEAVDLMVSAHLIDNTLVVNVSTARDRLHHASIDIPLSRDLLESYVQYASALNVSIIYDITTGWSIADPSP